MIEYFMDGLHPKLLKRVHTMEMVPNTLEGWIKAASKYKGQWKRAMAILGKTRQNEKTKETMKKGQPSLDINRLTNQECMEHLRKGLCFICHQPGHRLSDHRDGKNPNQMGSAPPPYRNCFTQKKTGVDTYQKIHTMLDELDEEEKERALNLMEELAESDNGKDIAMNALLNSGAGGVFIDSKFVKQEGIRTYPLGCTIRAMNVDGTLNKQGMIIRCMKGRLHIIGRNYPMEYLVARLGKESVILGLPWLQEINLIIDWKKGTFKFRDEG
ncbi:hypothetical protein L208DRAFT_1260062 [Tricholoma matsutake]|nr:hypothetical protein L208DRAFT_1260062 [Tricholoma matsutake 945]